ncbi:MAG: VanZ family protein [Acetobacterium sp.]|nr:VanZ family protein [Bacillota bacterium]MCG2729841.1 VanZ family protein [Acetobacterium sp.]
MNDLLFYANYLLNNGPFSSQKMIILTMLVVLILTTMLVLNGEKWTIAEKWFKTAIWFYLYLILLYTFLSRTGKSQSDYNLVPFWSYQYIFATHDFRIVLEVLGNCLMFIPVGILVPWAYENILHEDDLKKRNTVILFGLIVSVSVECLQLFTRTGLFEWDDIFHNMIGLLVGYGVYLLLKDKHFGTVYQYFLPMIGVGLALMIVMM